MKILNAALLLLLSLNLQAQTICDSLEYEVKFSAFNDSLIVLKLNNRSSELFDYPSFFFVDNQGDTIGFERANSFGIGTDYRTSIEIQAAFLGQKNLAGKFEVWKNFDDTLMCSYTDSFRLCPKDTCHLLYPSVSNLGGALADGNIEWNLFQGSQKQLTGNLILSNPSQQMDEDTICIRSGEYRLEYAAAAPTGGQVYAAVASSDGYSRKESPLSSFAAIINISLYESCVQSPNAIEIPLPEHSFKAWANQNVLNVISGDQDQPYRILNMKAQIVREFRQSQESFEIELNTLSSGPYLLQNGQNFQRFMIR